jgi:polyadenylate-binding protein
MLYEHFRVVGPVVSVRVCIDSQTHKSLGYGYVNFQNPADAERAIEQMNGSKLNDRPCRVSRIQRDPTQRKSGVTNIVIKNLPQTMDANTLKELFGKYGRVVSVKVPSNEEGTHRGYAYHV